MSAIDSEIHLPTLRMPILETHEFNWIRKYLHHHVGIALNENKQAMVMGRLEKRLRHHGFSSYGEYFNLFGKPGFEHETTMAIDLLTTNETYFFREPKHFEFLKNHLFPAHPSDRPLRIWSAASSSGEEAYTLGMLAAEHLSTAQWEIIGTDISTRMLEKARTGLYPLQAAEKIPERLLKNYCLKGNSDYDGFFLIDKELRKRIKFLHVNLIENLPDLGSFDVIFLRNVMIYFDQPTKQALVSRLLKHLKPGGHFFVSHSESLNGVNQELTMLKPSIYRKDSGIRA